MDERTKILWLYKHILSGECGRCLLLNDCLLLNNTTLTLSNFAGSMSAELKPCVVSICDHCTEAKESSCGVCSGIDSWDWNWRDEIKHRPDTAEDQFNLNPWDSEEPFNDMKDVKDKQDSGEPECSHRSDVEKSSTREARILRKLDA